MINPWIVLAQVTPASAAWWEPFIIGVLVGLIVMFAARKLYSKV